MDEFDFEIGADHLQVSAGKDFALIGIEFFRLATPFKGLFNAIQKRTKLFVVVILAVRN